MRQTRSTVIVVALLLNMVGVADEVNDAARQEQQRQAAFRNGFATIVDSLNVGSYELFAGAIDRNDFFARIYGLRLIEQRVKKDFSDQMQFRLVDLVPGGFPESKDGFKAHLLGVESRGDRGRALVRFDLPDLQFDYHEYELRLDNKNRVVIVDWIDYLQGERFTDGVGNALVMRAPSRAATRKLISTKTVSDADMFQFGELLKAARDQDASRYVDIINKLTPELQRERIVVLTSVQLTKRSRNRRLIRTALMQMAKHFPDEPLYSLMLLDYYVPMKMYDVAEAALQRMYRQFGFDDAAMEARLSAIELVAGNAEDAATHAKRAVELEPGLELAWWSTLRARAAIEDYAGAVEALQKLEQNHGHTLGHAELERDKSFAALLASAEFAAWAEGRK